MPMMLDAPSSAQYASDEGRRGRRLERF